MGTNDRTDPTTDFFDTTLSQVREISDACRVDAAAAGIKSQCQTIDQMCRDAISRGRLRTDMPAVIAAMENMRITHRGLTPAFQAELKRRILEAQDQKRPPRSTGRRNGP